MDEKQLLEQLPAEQKKSTGSHLQLTVLLTVLTALMAVSLCILVPRAVSTLDRADRELDQLETTLGYIDDMVQNANDILKENEEGLNNPSRPLPRSTSTA